MMARALLVLLLAVASTQAGHVRLPFLNPAGVTYLNHDAPVQYAAHAPVAHAHYAPAPAQVQYAAPAPVQYAAPAPVQYAAPVHQAHYAAPVHQAHYAAAPVHHGHYAHAAYATPLVGKVPAVAHVPAIAKVPGVADVPITKIHHTPGVINKAVDVAQPALAKRHFQVRRPAVRKEFYDVEQRIIVRPAGHALFELDQPISKTQIGHDSIIPTDAHIAPFVKAQTARKIIEGPAGAHASPLSAIGNPTHGSGPRPQHQGPSAHDDDESVVIPAGRSAQPPPPPPPQTRQGPAPFEQQQGPSPFEQQQGPSPFEQQQGPPQFQRREGPPSAAPRDLPAAPAPRGPPPPQAAPRGLPPPPPQQGPQQHGPISEAHFRTLLNDMPLEVQNRLVHLLGSRGAVTVVDGSDGPASVRVLEAAEQSSNLPLPGEERVTTRRIALLRPVETIQDVEIAEPITKLHRVNYQQPAVFKHATTGYARVPTQIPVQTTVPVAAKVPAVVGHAYAPAAYAHGGYYHQ